MAVVDDNLGAARDNIAQVFLYFFFLLGISWRLLCGEVLQRLDGEVVRLACHVIFVHQTIELGEAEEEGGIRITIGREVKD